LNRHVASAVAKDSPRGWRVGKAHRTAHIDAAMAMALERAEREAGAGGACSERARQDSHL